MKTLSDLILNAKESNNHLTFLSQDNETNISYAELFKKALKYLFQLQKSGINAGSELIIQIDDNLSFITTFWACILGGIKVVLLPYAKNQQQKELISTVIGTLKKPCVCVTSADYKDTAKSSYSCDVVILSDNSDMNIEQIAIHDNKPDDVAVIQFSSGSTGEPKGVSTTHKNIIKNSQALARRVNISSRDRIFSWLPLTHNFALFGFHITATLFTSNQIIMPTSDFLQNPISWIAEISNRKVTITSSPNFGFKHFLTFYDKSIQCFNWNLSSLRAIINGAEPISYELSISFLKTLEKYHMSNTVMVPAYGMSEATVGICVAEAGKPLIRKTLDRHSMNIGDKVQEVDDDTNGTFVSVGEPLHGVELRITDNKHNSLLEGCIGNIEVKSEIVMKGYYNNLDKTSEVFTKDGWLLTGDIGVLMNGELYITGRSKEIIFIAGKNYFPNDFEKIIECKFPSLKNNIAICGIYDKEIETEKIALFIEIGNEKFDDDFITKIKKNFAEVTRLQIEYVKFVDGIPRTANGKIQRYKLLELFKVTDNFVNASAKNNQQDNSIEKNDVVNTIITVCKEELKINNLALSDNLFIMGADSLKASIILARINEELSSNVTLKQLYQCDTVEKIVDLVKQNQKKDNAENFNFRCNEKKFIPVSAQQKRMYTLYSVDPDNTNYNINAAFEIFGEVEADRIQAAFTELVERHEALRTVFSFENNEIKQTILDNVKFSLEIIKSQDKDTDSLIKSCIRPFDLATGPLFRVFLIEQSIDRHILLIDIHHIITDGTSMGILVKEFVDLYNGKSLPKIQYNYRDYMLWQDKSKKNGSFEDKMIFWHKHLENRKAIINLPIDVPERPRYMKKFGDNIVFDTPTDCITTIASSLAVSKFSIMLSAYCILLSKYANQYNFTIGVPVSGRTKAQFLDVVGLFVNTIPLNVSVNPHDSIKEFVKYIGNISIDALANQDYQLDWLVDELHIKRESNRSPLFDIMFTMENMYIPPFKIGDCQVRQLAVKDEVCKFDLNMIVTEQEDGALDGNLVYSTELYKRSTMEMFINHYLKILKAMEDSDIQIGEISLADLTPDTSKLISLSIPEFNF